MLRELRTRIERFPLATPFRISRGVRTVAEVVDVTLSEGGETGRGESVPYARYGETPQSVMEQVDSIADDLRRGMTRQALQLALPAGAARNAVDCAMWDLEARLGTLADPLLPTGPVVTALTIGIDTPAAMARSARALAHVPLIKVKVNEDDPETCLRAVRAGAPTPRLIVDPNESWTFDMLEAMQPVLAELGVTFVEQPLASADDALLAGLTRRVPVCADESCHSASDLGRLSGLYDIVNIKLDKTGGLTEAEALLHAARAGGFGVMVGCMISSSLSIAPALQIATRADFADLDGPLWLKDDRPGGVALQDGRLVPPSAGFWGQRSDTNPNRTLSITAADTGTNRRN